MPRIDTARFLADLHELRQIGAYKTGVHRPTYSPQDMQARAWLMEKMSILGLEAGIDGIGNVYGRHTGRVRISSSVAISRARIRPDGWMARSA